MAAAIVSPDQCVDVSGSVPCAPWVAGMRPLKIPLMASLLADLSSQAAMSDQTAFDLTITALAFTSHWDVLLGCSGITTLLQAGNPFPVRFAESYSCSTTLSNTIRGSINAFPTCTSSTQLSQLPTLCKETCQAFASSFASFQANNPGLCPAATTTTMNYTQNYVVQQNVFNNICSTLKSAKDSIQGGMIGCVTMSLGDYASCGFGNNTGGLAAAKSYCTATGSGDPCCKNLGASIGQAYTGLGFAPLVGVSSSPASTKSDPGALAGSMLGTLVFVLSIGAATYFLYRKRRNADGTYVSTSLPGKPTGGASAGVTSPHAPGAGGLVLGKGSRLSFAPPKRPYQNFESPKATPANGPTLTPPARSAASLAGPNARNFNNNNNNNNNNFNTAAGNDSQTYDYNAGFDSASRGYNDPNQPATYQAGVQRAPSKKRMGPNAQAPMTGNNNNVPGNSNSGGRNPFNDNYRLPPVTGPFDDSNRVNGNGGGGGYSLADSLARTPQGNQFFNGGTAAAGGGQNETYQLKPMNGSSAQSGRPPRGY